MCALFSPENLQAGAVKGLIWISITSSAHVSYIQYTYFTGLGSEEVNCDVLIGLSAGVIGGREATAGCSERQRALCGLGGLLLAVSATFAVPRYRARRRHSCLQTVDDASFPTRSTCSPTHFASPHSADLHTIH